MGQILAYIVKAAFVSTGLMLLALVFRLAFKRAPSSARMALWALVALRLLAPSVTQSVVSLQPDIGELQSRLARAGGVRIVVSEPLQSEPRAIPGEQQIANISGYTNQLAQAKAAGQAARENSMIARAFILWLSGAAVIALREVLRTHKLKRKLRRCEALAKGVYLFEFDAPPFTLGVFAPRVYLPKHMSESARGYALRHERAHIRGLDGLKLFVMQFICCAYWFHPLIWIARAYFLKDMELACDARAVKGLDMNGKRGYLHTLVECAARTELSKPGGALTCAFASAKKEIKERVRNVMLAGKKRLLTSVIAALCVMLLGVCFLTEPVSSEPSNADETGVNVIIRREGVYSVGASAGNLGAGASYADNSELKYGDNMFLELDVPRGENIEYTLYAYDKDMGILAEARFTHDFSVNPCVVLAVSERYPDIDYGFVPINEIAESRVFKVRTYPGDDYTDRQYCSLEGKDDWELAKGYVYTIDVENGTFSVADPASGEVVYYAAQIDYSGTPLSPSDWWELSSDGRLRLGLGNYSQYHKYDDKYEAPFQFELIDMGEYKLYIVDAADILAKFSSDGNMLWSMIIN